MKWIEDNVFSDKEYNKKRKLLEEKSEEFIKKYPDVFKTEENKKEFRRLVYNHLTGNCNKSEGESVSDYLLKTFGTELNLRSSIIIDPDFGQFVEDLKDIHDEFLQKAIEMYENAKLDQLEKSRFKEIQMYGSLISGLITNSKNVGQETSDNYIEVYTVSTKREELIPHDKLFEYGKKTLKVLSNTNVPYPKEAYEDLLKTLKDRLEYLVRMSPDDYFSEKTIVLNDQKIKQNANLSNTKHI